ncbi:MAG TPA: PhzF family phenazine biosynthesis protein [Propionicimonas sp.]|nr:PhzF family phenazine biosynthesis protein [Propionicimonas sp.]HRA07555.1 PhzF family phenazine biosynthesis protein [Propionicimonas sp.]
MKRPFAQVDVFGDGGISGNPLAVVLDGSGLDDAELQSFASWTNLSETTFLFPPDDAAADYRVRIFTGSAELPFAGHPTLGSAHAWLAAGGRPRTPGRLVQECGAGLVQLHLDDDRLAFAAPVRLRTGPLDPATVQLAEAVLGIPSNEWVAHEWGDNGPPWMMIQLADAAAVRAASIDHSRLGPTQHLGLIGLSEGPSAYEVRGFVGNWEDPVTGSLNAAAAQWLRARSLVPPTYMATQGSRLGRRGEIFVHDDGTAIWIGGRVRTVVSGTADL